jgi:CRP/FNR family cyclic AMP-dependent transcriptional regulator
MPPHESDLLAGLSPDDASQVLVLGGSRALSPGEVIFELGDEASDLFLVKKGRVELTLPMRVGGVQEDVPVEERMPVQMLGWSALVPPHRFTLKATATVETELLAIPREELQRFFNSRPALGLLVMTNLAGIVGQRFQLFQTMWLRQVQQAVEMRNG